jgi:hypothetical protein
LPKKQPPFVQFAVNPQMALPTESYDIGGVRASFFNAESVNVMEFGPILHDTRSAMQATSLAYFLVTSGNSLPANHPFGAGVEALALWRNSTFPRCGMTVECLHPMDAVDVGGNSPIS